MVLACVIAGSHAYLVGERARRLDGHHGRDGRAGRSARSGTRSSSRRRIRRWPTSGSSPSTRCSTSASSCCCARGRARSAGTLWLDGATAALGAAAFGAAVIFELVADATAGSTSVGRHQPRVPARRRPSALGRLRRLRAHGLAARACAGSSSASAFCRPRSRTPSTSSSPQRGRTSRARGSTSSGPLRCCSSQPPPG